MSTISSTCWIQSRSDKSKIPFQPGDLTRSLVIFAEASDKEGRKFGPLRSMCSFVAKSSSCSCLDMLVHAWTCFQLGRGGRKLGLAVWNLGFFWDLVFGIWDLLVVWLFLCFAVLCENPVRWYAGTLPKQRRGGREFANLRFAAWSFRLRRSGAPNLNSKIYRDGLGRLGTGAVTGRKCKILRIYRPWDGVTGKTLLCVSPSAESAWSWILKFGDSLMFGSWRLELPRNGPDL